MTQRLVIRPEAEADLREALAWYEGRQLGLGDEFLAEVKGAIDRTVAGPLRFPIVHKKLRRAEPVADAKSHARSRHNFTARIYSLGRVEFFSN